MSIDALPYHDPEPSDAERTAADTLITRILPSHLPPHPSLPSYSEWSPSSMLMQQELDRVSRGEKLSAIDLTRYEDIEAPESHDLNAWRLSMDRNIVAAAAMKAREENLEMLKTFGVNAWSMHVYQMEQSLKKVEEELLQARQETEKLNIARKKAQVEAGLRLAVLDEKWRSLISSNIEVSVACALLKQRESANGGDKNR